MGKIEGIRIKNFGPLKDIVMGKTLSNQKTAAFSSCDPKGHRIQLCLNCIIGKTVIPGLLPMN